VKKGWGEEPGGAKKGKWVFRIPASKTRYSITLEGMTKVHSLVGDMEREQSKMKWWEHEVVSVGSDKRAAKRRVEGREGVINHFVFKR